MRFSITFRPFILFVGAIVFCSTATAWAGNRADRYSPAPTPRLARIYYDEIADLDRLSSYDLHEYNNLVDRYVLATLATNEIEHLRVQGWSIVAESDQQSLPDRNRFFGNYRTVEEIYEALEQLAASHESLTALVPYGASYCKLSAGCETPGADKTDGFDLLALRITNENVPGASIIGQGSVTRGQKPVFFILANIHARELTTPEIAMRWISLLLDQYGKNPDVTWLINWHELWIIPIANPDGHWIVELGDSSVYGGYPFMQRKNFDQDADNDGHIDCGIWPPYSGRQSGVDLNRNHSFGWQVATDSCSATYSGPMAASEPEVSALQDLVRALFSDRRSEDPFAAAPSDTSGLLFTLHNYGNLVLRPWGNSSIPAPNEEGLKAIGDKMATLTGYHSCQPADCLYLSSGTTDDWAYGELGIPAYTFEIGSSTQGFSPHYSVIDAEQWPQNRDAFLYAAMIARHPYELIHGPDIKSITTGSISEENLLLTVTVDDTDHGRQPVVHAEYSVDAPFWTPQAAAQALLPLDANSGEPQATFQVFVDISNLTPGLHTIFVHGQDADGNFGVTRSTTIFKIAPYSEVYYLPYTSSLP